MRELGLLKFEISTIKSLLGLFQKMGSSFEFSCYSRPEGANICMYMLVRARTVACRIMTAGPTTLPTLKSISLHGHMIVLYDP